MVRDKAEQEERRVAARLEHKERARGRRAQKQFKLAAKKAREWRKAGVLDKLFIYCQNGRIRKAIAH